MDKRIRRHVSGRIRDLFAVTMPGLEDICRQELVGLGLDCCDRSPAPGGVAFKGRFVDCQRANLHLRTATRILMRIEAFTATNARQLSRKCAAIPWELFLPAGPMPEIKVSSRRSRLYHTGLVADCVRDGLAGRLGTSAASLPTGLTQTLFVRLADDQATLSLDSSGDALYKRGLKQGPARAPLRETLAAAILLTAGYDRRHPLVDPMCGSGTFSLEAAMLARQMAPGARRTFAFMGWPAFQEVQWNHLKREAEAAVSPMASPAIFASDIDGGACAQLADHIAANGMSDAVAVAHKDFFLCEGGHYGGIPGLVAINPPYGIRIGSADAAADLFNRIVRHLVDAFGGWDAALVTPERSLLETVPFPVRQVPLMHGGLKLTLCLGKIGIKAGR
ncbi:MAG TPA: hypothetical protein VLT88_11290 [Desulfosarcina sp.]|nr:hypothetical protein [Desulfosarcina sp.]